MLMPTDALKTMIAYLDTEVQACRPEITKPPRQPVKLQRLLALLARREEIFRAQQSVQTLR